MDSDPPKSKTARRKSFRPKPPPPPRAPIIATPKIEEEGGDDLVRKFNEHLARRGERAEKKSSVQVVYSLDKDFASTSIKSFGKQRERTDDESKSTEDGSIVVYSEASVTGEMQNLVTSISVAETQEVADNSVDLTNTASVKKKKEYQEPWDYHQSDYPIILPIRRPYSGDPEVLDKAEFEEALEYNEDSHSAASNLDLWPQNIDETHKMIFFKLPTNLPLGRQPTNASRRGTDGNSTGTKGKEIVGSSSGYPLKKDDSLEELDKGYMGKMLVFKSGAVKLKLGDIMYDVSPNADYCFPQSVMAINVTDKQCCEIGNVSKRAVVTPDIDSLLDSEKD